MDAATAITDGLERLLDGLWIGGLAATPLALVVALLCRIRSLRPATRHVLWGAVLLSFVTPALGTIVWRPAWFRSEHLASAADSALATLESALPNPSSASTPNSTELSSEPPCPDLTDDSACKSEPSWATEIKDEDPSIDMSWFTCPVDEAASALFASDGSPIKTPAADQLSSEHTRPGHAPRTTLSGTSGLFSAADAIPRPSPRSSPVADLPGLPPLASVVTKTPEIDAAPKPAEPSKPAENGETARTPSRFAAIPAAARTCVARALDLRDAVAALPPIPASVWFGGAALLIIVRLSRTFAAMRIMRKARPADAEIRALVSQTAQRIGLSSPPETYVVVSAVSPMVLCGLKPRLIIPLPLWRSLEPEAKRAVLVHELAHLRRRDHVMCWVEMIISALYWWHPVAWWAGARLRDHAEASCDAWVTKLLPSSRRAYAVALVATKSYLSLRGQGTGPWLGIVSGSAGKLERRITMVMTQRTTPRVSVIGACVATVVIGLGMFVMPSVACPPEESQAHAAKVEAKAKSEKAKTEKAAKDEANAFFGEAPALEAMRGGGSGGGGGAAAVAPGKARAPKAPKPPQPPQAARPARAPEVTVRSGPASGNSLTIAGDDYTTGRITKVYKLPEGKLDAFWELMSRSDVPILVQMQGDGILVYATAEQHPQIEAFIRIISPSSGPTSIITGPRVADTAPFARGAANYSEALKVHRDALRQTELNRATVEREAEKARDQAEKARDQAEQLKELTQSLHGQMKEVQEQEARAALERAASQIRARSDAIRSQSRNMDTRVRDLERQLEQLEKRTEEIEQQLEELEGMEPDEEDGQTGAFMTMPALPPSAFGGTGVAGFVAPTDVAISGFAPIAVSPAPIAPVTPMPSLPAGIPSTTSLSPMTSPIAPTPAIPALPAKTTTTPTPMVAPAAPSATPTPAASTTSATPKPSTR